MSNKIEGAWIFVSHSLKDWDKVRGIRNLLEEKGHKPLLFFLKCLNDDSEIDDLIKREIESRNWFILCDSTNSKESKWVKAEIDFIKSLEDKIYEVIDLEKDIDTQLEKINRLSKRITIFLSYSHLDIGIAQDFVRVLRDHDYRVFDDRQIPKGNSFEDHIEIEINESIKNGFFLLLITENSLNSFSFRYEINYAIKKAKLSTSGGNIIPISFLNLDKLNSSIPLKLSYLISKSNLKIHDFSRGLLEHNLNSLIKILKTQKMD